MIIKEQLVDTEIKSLLEAQDYPPYLAALLAARIKNTAEIDYSASTLIDYLQHNLNTLKGLQDSTEFLAENITKNRQIAIVGDYDCDGATATSVMYLGLKKCLLQSNPKIIVPDRVKTGYGLTPELIDQQFTKNIDTVITVDNGISAKSGIQKCRDMGINVVVTDHHLQDASIELNTPYVVNPNQVDCPFPDKGIAGVGVAFLVIYNLVEFLDREGWFEHHQASKPKTSDLLDLVAIGTVADMVPISSYLNRCFIHIGLKLINSGKARLGIKKLIEHTVINKKLVSAQSIAFNVAPKINAAGRLENMNIGIELLISENEKRADLASESLVKLNEQRKLIEEEMTGTLMINDAIFGKLDKRVMVYYHEEFHEGVVGIVAGRYKERTNKPTVVFCNTANEVGVIKGSCRSIEGFNIRDALVNIHAQDSSIILKFGGHAMAAGLTIHKEKLDRFTELFTREYVNVFGNVDIEPEIQVDLITDDTIFEAESINTLDCLPWGNKFSYPLFMADFKIVEVVELKNQHKKIIFENPRTHSAIIGMLFSKNYDHDSVFLCGDTLKVIFSLSNNYWKGTETPQLIIQQIVWD